MKCKQTPCSHSLGTGVECLPWRNDEIGVAGFNRSAVGTHNCCGRVAGRRETRKGVGYRAGMILCTEFLGEFCGCTGVGAGYGYAAVEAEQGSSDSSSCSRAGIGHEYTHGGIVYSYLSGLEPRDDAFYMIDRRSLLGATVFFHSAFKIIVGH